MDNKLNLLLLSAVWFTTEFKRLYRLINFSRFSDYFLGNFFYDGRNNDVDDILVRDRRNRLGRNALESRVCDNGGNDDWFGVDAK
jgi:hypothetical protein